LWSLTEGRPGRVLVVCKELIKKEARNGEHI